MRIWEGIAGVRWILISGVLLVLLYNLGFKWLLPMMADRLVVPSDLRKADAIVVLGDELWDGTLSERSLRRTVYAIQLLKEGYAPQIVFTGGSPSSSSIGKMFELALGLGVDSSKVILEEQSSSTYENAYNVRQIFDQNGWQSALLVTSSWHIRRASGVFEKQGITIYKAPIIFFEQYTLSLREDLILFEAVIPEYIKSAYYLWKGWM